MITEAFAGALVGACEGDAAVEADAEGLALGVTLAFADGFGVWVGFGVALGSAVAVDLVPVVAVVGLGVADVVGVGAGVATTLAKPVGGGDYGAVELGPAIVDETGASDAGTLAAGVALVAVFECATREIATVPITRPATPAAAARAVIIPRPRDGDSHDCGNSRALLCTRPQTANSTRR
jgi:hypothetical protein